VMIDAPPDPAVVVALEKIPGHARIPPLMVFKLASLAKACDAR
jgi:hypothetical protein